MPTYAGYESRNIRDRHCYYDLRRFSKFASYWFGVRLLSKEKKNANNNEA